ncbi:glycosyltransferase family 1 protein [Halomonas sp. MCCC 1A17488]|uniref:glycosyltransferase family 4 protein n=1 Tax=unclassified Halomonas TaxID=2609666 RepID=UPI0018D262EA|nr:MULTISPECIES: glycosyltransferase family 1 protein [unclassified Halomonas]MCE8017853.1 glycosyltransferase family 1 protein [Halomonas sp. MCCC 1A17488]MCG3241186.1 glycosyltransferase family 1 protein [Halomonas sp. MCCC 1A17488]QPP49036.1 glycosyltransferase family 1 protein [Halomonas sp. SS10-MC5]
MRICLVSETWSPEINGVAHTLLQLSQELLARGMSLQLIRPHPADAGAPRRTRGMQAELRVPGVAIPGYRAVRIGMPAARRIQRLWQKQRPDVVYLATQGPLGWSARRVARRLGIPLVAGWHTNFDHYCGDYGVPWLAPTLMRALRHFHNGCQATLVPTRQQAEELVRQGFERLEVMGRGIEHERFSPALRCSELRRRWGVGEHRPVALYVGRLAAEKNLGLLRETLHAMRSARPDMAQVIVGDGPARRSLEKALPDVHFTGFISPEALSRHYASADLFLFPSLSETWGNVVPEAMASGLAVVAYRHAAAAELIDSGANGVTVAAGDAAAFREAAVALCQQPARYARMGRAARLRSQACRWPAVADTFLSALEQAREVSHATTHPCRI